MTRIQFEQLGKVVVEYDGRALLAMFPDGTVKAFASSKTSRARRQALVQCAHRTGKHRHDRMACLLSRTPAFAPGRISDHTQMRREHMTEDHIERRVQYATDRLDARLMSGRLSQAEYDDAIMRLDKWAEQQYDARGCT